MRVGQDEPVFGREEVIDRSRMLLENEGRSNHVRRGSRDAGGEPMKKLDVVVLMPENASEEEELAKVIRGCMVLGRDISFDDVLHQSHGRFATVGEPWIRLFHVQEDSRGKRTVHEDHSG